MDTAFPKDLDGLKCGPITPMPIASKETHSLVKMRQKNTFSNHPRLSTANCMPKS